MSLKKISVCSTLFLLFSFTLEWRENPHFGGKRRGWWCEFLPSLIRGVRQIPPGLHILSLCYAVQGSRRWSWTLRWWLGMLVGAQGRQSGGHCAALMLCKPQGLPGRGWWNVKYCCHLQELPTVTSEKSSQEAGCSLITLSRSSALQLENKHPRWLLKWK